MVDLNLKTGKLLEGVTLRSIMQEDEKFLSALYASTRDDEMAITPWSDEEKEDFLKMQFTAQHTYYLEQFKSADFDMIELNGQPIGRFYIDRRRDEIRLIDITLLPEYRGAGLGKLMMQLLLDEAVDKMLPVRLHVEGNNPARRLYDRLGFKPIADKGVYEMMEWRPEEVVRVSTAG